MSPTGRDRTTKRGHLAELTRTGFPTFLAVQTVLAWSGPFFAVALVWLTLETRRDPGLLGAYLGLIDLGQILMLPAGGVVADRAGAKKVLSVSLVAGAVLVLLTSTYALMPHASSAFFYTIALLTGVNGAIARPASASLLSSLVHREHLQAANGVLELSRQLGSFIAPLLASLVVARLGGVAALWLEGVCLLIAALGFSLARIPGESGKESSTPPPPGSRHDSSKGKPSVLREVLEGLRIVKASRFLAAVLAFSVAGNLALEGPLRVAVPCLVQSELNRSTTDYALLLSLFGVGGIVGAVLTSVAPGPRSPGLVVLGLWALLGISLVVLGVIHHWLAALVTMGIVGATVTSATILVWATLQAQLQPQIIGRVTSLILLASLAPGSVSLVVTGWISTNLGAAAPLVAGGSVIVIISAVAALVPEIRQGSLSVVARRPTYG